MLKSLSNIPIFSLKLRFFLTRKMRKTVDFLRFACHFFAVCVSGNT